MTKKKLNLIFMGTPEFAASHLRQLLEYPNDFHISCVYTREDKPKGRKQQIIPSPVKTEALSHQIPVFQPRNFKEKSTIEQLASFNPDIIVVVAYGVILKTNLLAIPTYGSINIHASLLPRYRGASPIQHTLLNGDSLTGVTSFILEEGIDTGPILLQKETPVSLHDDYKSLEKKLECLGKECLIETLFRIRQSDFQFKGHSQSGPEPTYTSKITKEMAILNFEKTAMTLHNQVRALNDWPVCSTKFQIDRTYKEIKIYKTEPLTPPCPQILPGQLHFPDKKTLHIGTKDGCLKVLEVQMQGKKRMPISAFLNGARLENNTFVRTTP